MGAGRYWRRGRPCHAAFGARLLQSRRAVAGHAGPASQAAGGAGRRRMKLAILAVGHRQPGWVSEGCAEYLKRMPRELAACVTEIKPEPRGSKTREQLLAAERARLREAMPGSCRLVVLDEKGDDLTTMKLAKRLEVWMQDGRDVALLIGGADGLEEEFKQPD